MPINNRRNCASYSRRPIHTSLAVTLAMGGITTPELHAQEAEAALEEITVTARRRAEDLQDTPIAVSAFTPEALERRQIFSTQDLGRVTPNLQFKSHAPLSANNAAAQVFIRGIGQTDASSGVDPGVGFYIDDVYMGRSVGAAMDFMDVSNVQVLRGPQGTLFGRNTIGGAVLLTTKEPGNDFGGTTRVGIGEDRLREGFAAISVPMTDTLAARVSLGARKRDGYVTRVVDGIDLGNEDSYTARASLRWQPTDDFKFTLRGDYTESDEHGSPYVFAAINTQAAFPAAVSVAAGCPGATFPPPSVPQSMDTRCANNTTWDLGPFKNGGTAPVFSTLENWGTSAVAQWDLTPQVTLKSITSYRELSWSGGREADNTPFVIIDSVYSASGHQVSQELQSLVTLDRLNGVLGAFYFTEKFDDLITVNSASPPPVVAAGGPYSRDWHESELDNDNWALFTQWTYKITDPLSVTGGLRYTEETKRASVTSLVIFPNTAPNPDPFPTTAPPLFVDPAPHEKTFTALTGAATVQYRWSDAVMTYLSWSQGFKSGGFNQRYNAPTTGIALPVVAFDEERAETYELGIKTEFGGSLRMNGAVFNTSYEDMQLIYRLGIAPLLFNAGEATIQGAEFEITYAPGSWLVEGSVGYLDDSLDEVANIAVPGSQVSATVSTDSTLPFTPEWQASLGIGYSFDLTSQLALTPRVDASYTDEQFFDAANSPEVAQLESVTIYNASLTFEYGDWRLIGGVNNLSDEVYHVAGNSSFRTASGYAEVINARPRNWFLRATYDF